MSNNNHGGDRRSKPRRTTYNSLERIRSNRSTLIAKHRCFVREYVKTLPRNAYKAYKAAGYKGEGAYGRDAAYEIVNRPDVRAAIEEEEAIIDRQSRFSADRVLLEVMRLATVDFRKLYDRKGNMIPVHELDDETAAAVAGLKLTKYPVEIDDPSQRRTNGQRRKITVWRQKWEYKTWDKNKALTLAMQHKGLLKGDTGRETDPEETAREIKEALQMIWNSMPGQDGGK